MSDINKILEQIKDLERDIGLLIADSDLPVSYVSANFVESNELGAKRKGVILTGVDVNIDWDIAGEQK